MLIAIDGPAASGKGTVARRLAKEFGLDYLDTGRIYRAVGNAVLERGVDIDDAEKTKVAAIEVANALDVAHIEGEHLETEEVGRAASIVSAIPEVRAILLDFQKKVATSE